MRHYLVVIAALAALVVTSSTADVTIVRRAAGGVGPCDGFSEAYDLEEDFGNVAADGCDSGQVENSTFFVDNANTTILCDDTTTVYAGENVNIDDDGGNSAVYVDDVGTDNERRYQSVVMRLPLAGDIGDAGYFRAMAGTTTVCRITVTTGTFWVQTDLGGDSDTGVTASAETNYALRFETEEGTDGFCTICIKVAADDDDSWGTCTQVTYNDNKNVNRSRFNALPTNRDVLFDRFRQNYGTAIDACEYADLP